jgi:hypothetical protein
LPANYFYLCLRYLFVMVQEIIILLIFLLAAGYVLRLGYKSFFSKDLGCAKGCGSACSTIDLEKIAREIEASKQKVAK